MVFGDELWQEQGRRHPDQLRLQRWGILARVGANDIDRFLERDDEDDFARVFFGKADAVDEFVAAVGENGEA